MLEMGFVMYRVNIEEKAHMLNRSRSAEERCYLGIRFKGTVICL